MSGSTTMHREPLADAAIAEAKRERSFVYLVIITVAAGYGLAGIFSGSIAHAPQAGPVIPRPPQVPIYCANDISRWCTVWSLVERGTYQIDDIIREPGWDTIDKGRFQDHFYSSKPPFVATLVAGLYYILKEVGSFDLLQRPQDVVPIILLIVNWLPWTVALLLIAQIGERYAQTNFSKIYLVATAAGGTFLTTFLVTLNNHTLAACGVVFALYPLLRIMNDGRRNGWVFAMAGFWGAFTACCEIPAAAFGLALFVLAFRQDSKQTWKWFVPAALVPLAFFFYTNWLCTGGFMPFYANFGSPNDTFYNYVYNGMPSYWSNPTALDRGESSAFIYLFHCLIGHHGILSLSPVFLLTIAGWTRLGRAFPLRTAGWLSLGLTVWVLDFYLFQTQSYNYGGITSGLRWAFWLIPLWLLALVPAVDRWSGLFEFRVLAALLLLNSIFSAAYARDNPWQQPWLWRLFN